MSTQESIFPECVTFAVRFKLYAVLIPPGGNDFSVRCFRLGDYFNVDWTRFFVFITSVPESRVGCWQVPLSVSPSGHSWTVYSTKLLCCGTALNTQTYDGKMEDSTKYTAGAPVRASHRSGKDLSFPEPLSQTCAEALVMVFTPSSAPRTNCLR